MHITIKFFSKDFANKSIFDIINKFYGAIMDNSKKIFNIPNTLCFIRILLIPVFATLYLLGYTYLSMAIFMVACATDVIDGFIARHFNMITDFGKVIDPIADKLLKLTTLICFTVKGIFPIYFLIVMIILDLFLTISSGIIISKGVIIPSNVWGKLATLFVLLGLYLAFFVADYPFMKMYCWVIIGLGLLLVLVSAISYGIKFLKIQKERASVDNLKTQN